MAIQKEKITAFFEAYEQRFNDALKGEIDVNETASVFADCFIEASPLGVQCGKNDQRFREAIHGGYEFYKNIGTQSMQIRGLDITAIDEFHVMAKVYWRARYKKKDGIEISIEFDVTYMVQTIDERINIFAYVTGDEQAALQQHGLLNDAMTKK